MNDDTTEGSEIRSWRDLIVWQKSHRLVLDIYRLTAGFPRDERYRLTDQLCRAAASVSTNIAEGKGRYSSGEYAKFVTIAKGSAEEVQYLLLLAKDLEYISPDIYSEISTRYQEVGKLVYGLLMALKKRQ